MTASRMRVLATAAAVAIAGALTAAGAARAQVPAAEADYGGYATGTVVHAEALQGTPDPEEPDTRAVDAEVVMSRASADSQGLTTEIQNEMERVVSPVLDGKSSFGAGTSLEAGLGLSPPSSEGQIILPPDPAQASAPPSTDLVTVELGSGNGGDLVYGELLRTQAEANWQPASCVLGADLGFGLARAANAELIDQAADEGTEDLDAPLVSTNAPTPERAVSESNSRLRLVPQVSQDGTVEGDALGLMSETRMTIAPITLNLGEEAVFTLEVLGEWVLRAVATGHSGYVHFGPGEVSPQSPILRVIDQTTGEVTDIVTFQEILPGAPLLGEEGLVVPIEPLGIEVAIGEDPRAIGGDAESAPTETATEASAALDVVRVRVLDGPGAEQGLTTLTDLRVGHMEVQARVPAGGISCDLPVTKVSDKDTVQPGEDFTYTITVDNPYDCTLTNVRVVDNVSATPGTTFQIDGASDGGQVSGNTVTWDDVGPIEPGESKSVTVTMRAGADSAPGTITDVVDVTASCALGAADGETQVDVGLSGQARIDLPNVGLAEVAAEEEERGPLPRTGGPLAGLAALALLGGGLGLRRLHRLRR